MSTETEKKMKTLNIAKKMITLETSDKETFIIEEAVALKLQTIGYMIEDGCADNVIRLLNITSESLAKVIEYCIKHVEEERKNDADQDKGYLEKWDAEYIAMDERALFYLLLAADFFNCQGLLDLALQAVVDRVKGKAPEEIRKEFNIKNDMPPELEEEIRSNNQWAFEASTECSINPRPSTSDETSMTDTLESVD